MVDRENWGENEGRTDGAQRGFGRGGGNCDMVERAVKLKNVVGSSREFSVVGCLVARAERETGWVCLTSTPLFLALAPGSPYLFSVSLCLLSLSLLSLS